MYNVRISTWQRKPSRMVTGNEKSSSQYKATIIGGPKVFCPICTKWSCVTPAFATFLFSLRRFKPVDCVCSKRWRTSWLRWMGETKAFWLKIIHFEKILKETSAKLIEFRGLKYMLLASSPHVSILFHILMLNWSLISLAPFLMLLNSLVF